MGTSRAAATAFGTTCGAKTWVARTRGSRKFLFAAQGKIEVSSYPARRTEARSTHLSVGENSFPEGTPTQQQITRRKYPGSSCPNSAFGTASGFSRAAQIHAQRFARYARAFAPADEPLRAHCPDSAGVPAAISPRLRRASGGLGGHSARSEIVLSNDGFTCRVA